MSQFFLWISGPSRSGKTTRLVAEFQHWVQTKLGYDRSKKSERHRSPGPGVLVFASNNDHRYNLADKLSNAVPESYPVICKSPLGFISDEVILFWPLLLEPLQLKAQFPLRLRPETEQELATQLWSPRLEGENPRLVRYLLDLIQLAGASCIPIETIPQLLKQGLENPIVDPDLGGELLLQWRQWCLDRGLLTYGIIYDLYWSYLWPQDCYRQQLASRYEAIFADDLDDYPAIARDLFEFYLDQGKFSVFTYNPQGKIRQGLGADPEYLSGIQERCRVELLSKQPQGGLAYLGEDAVTEIIHEPSALSLSPAWRAIQTTSRAELLRRVSEVIIQGVKKQEVKPEEIAIIAPGLDEIARYSLIEMLSHQGINLEPLNEQRPLSSSPLVRALLTLLALVYPDLGRLLSAEAIAEMLVVLTQSLDPVRAGILADYCYQVDIQSPHLLPVERFPRWDRLGAQGTYAYQKVTTWIDKQKTRVQTEKLSPILFLNQAIKNFFSNKDKLNYEKMVVLRELMETAQHYWEVDRRLRQHQITQQTLSAKIADFIKLLRIGTITANPYPLGKTAPNEGKVTLATIFQYRSLRSSHRWHFWLDAGSVLWQKGGAAMLLGAPLFWHSWSGQLWTAQDELQMDQELLERILGDLWARVSDRVYLCHSDLSVNGTEQLGPLLSLVYRAQEI
ncbi:hypothetical protein [Gloeocapsa sp. PCC 73106]|uniref:hypothetical protein n=1 Tax=Gloeocapsa sp. PCC 73106 TaxID=102232 RepID=UPI0002ABCD72|nr:hypothetical protein [Gloeocapsa sp. PCC 73106]ELR97298.1 hypothetical protein GLO73106DRAFT_00011060 [Gloeocapsa sp. PCC 73106]